LPKVFFHTRPQNFYSTPGKNFVFFGPCHHPTCQNFKAKWKSPPTQRQVFYRFRFFPPWYTFFLPTEGSLFPNTFPLLLDSCAPPCTTWSPLPPSQGNFSVSRGAAFLFVLPPTTVGLPRGRVSRLSTLTFPPLFASLLGEGKNPGFFFSPPFSTFLSYHRSSPLNGLFSFGYL